MSPDEDIFEDEKDDKKEKLFLRLSPSQIGAYVRCKFQFYAQYILKWRRDPMNHNLYFGLKFDDSLNANYANQLNTGKNLPKDDIKDYFSDIWGKEEETVEEWEGNCPKTLREIGIRGIDAFYDDVIPTVQVEMVQPKLDMKFDESDVILVGRPDLVEKSNKDLVIVDNKTTAKTSVPQSYADMSPQASLYPLFLAGMRGGKLIDQEFRFDILMKKKKPSVVQLKTIKTAKDQEVTLKMISNVVSSIHQMHRDKNFPPDAFWRGHFGDWSCSYCSCAELCRETWGLNIPESKRSDKPKYPADWFVEKAKKGAKGGKK